MTTPQPLTFGLLLTYVSRRASITCVDAWLIWLIAAVALLVAELFSLELVLIMFSLGGFAASISAGRGLNLLVQSLIFAAVSILALVLVRPIAQKWLHRQVDPAKTGIEALIGAQAIVLRPVDEFQGLIKLNGEEWSAQAIESGETFEQGEKVYVMQIKGATALVRRQQ